MLNIGKGTAAMTAGRCLEEVATRPLTVIIVDDQSSGRLIFSEIVKGIDESIQIMTFSNALDAVDFATTHVVDLVLTDYKMPGLDGLAAIRRLRELYSHDELSIVVVTVIKETNVRHEALECGATDFLTRPLDPWEARVRCENLLRIRRQFLANQAAIANLEHLLEQLSTEIREQDHDLRTRLAQIAALRRGGSEQHFKRCVAVVASAAGLSQQQCEQLLDIAPLIHLGLIGLHDNPTALGSEPSPQPEQPSPTYPQISHELLRYGPSAVLSAAAVISLACEEHYDGCGFPNGLAGEAIPLEARVLAIAHRLSLFLNDGGGVNDHHINVFCNFLATHRGNQFDPQIVDCLLVDPTQVLQQLQTST